MEKRHLPYKGSVAFNLMKWVRVSEEGERSHTWTHIHILLPFILPTYLSMAGKSFFHCPLTALKSFFLMLSTSLGISSKSAQKEPTTPIVLPS